MAEAVENAETQAGRWADQLLVRVLPSSWLIAAVLGLCVVGGVVTALDGFHLLWWFVAGVVFALALWDVVSLLREPLLGVVRRFPERLPVGVPSPVTLVFRGGPQRRLAAEWIDHQPQVFTVEGSPGAFLREPLNSVSARYTVRPTRRGDHYFGPVQVRVTSALGLWRRNDFLDAQSTHVRVYPNFAPVLGHMRLGTVPSTQVGIRPGPYRGEGSEFRELRDYREGDALRQIDWRASARARKPISREYQEERDQSVVFLLDCGRRMRAHEGLLSHFDAALNAILLLAYVALRQGDSVGFTTLAAQGRCLAPVKGPSRIDQLLNALYDLEPSLETPDYAAGAIDLLRFQRKHALVIVVTDLRAEALDDLLPALVTLRRRHRVVLASIYDQSLHDASVMVPSEWESALRVAGVHQYLREREQSLAEVRAANVLCVDTSPAELSATLTQAYLDLKRAHAV